MYSMAKTRGIVLFLMRSKKDREKLLENFLSIRDKGASVSHKFLGVPKKLIFSYIQKML